MRNSESWWVSHITEDLCRRLGRLEGNGIQTQLVAAVAQLCPRVLVAALEGHSAEVRRWGLATTGSSKHNHMSSWLVTCVSPRSGWWRWAWPEASRAGRCSACSCASCFHPFPGTTSATAEWKQPKCQVGLGSDKGIVQLNVSRLSSS